MRYFGRPARSIADNLAEVHETIRRGETIRAIKAYREATGTSLVEAKQAVDRLTEGGSGR
jgi:ribosomal protein L7/L12